jgi:hypothetical protein
MKTWEIAMFLWVLLFIIVMLCIAGCSHYSLEVDGKKFDLWYVLQDKNFKSIKYDPNTGSFEVTGFGSETSQLVSTIAEIVK